MAFVENLRKLNLYEENRTPQNLLESDVEINARALQAEFVCPICLEVLNKTMTTKNCLHRFCYDCIISAIRSGKKECPTCRTKLVSKRDLRQDTNFDFLILTLFPEKDKHASDQEELLTIINRSQAASSNQLRQKNENYDPSGPRNVETGKRKRGRPKKQTTEAAETSSSDKIGLKTTRKRKTNKEN
ncbi:E3 ubiquitin-protein ligase RING2-like [Cylas formicarius]|uniref:E3 ubiquitin-protein ligase RING2-like n=1 Tax=Cylas formicarius TaxID=197179 RepID=UPI0029585372|nr:E3 ubiquitin-protein ligase RING2-like [Cylas formicarius]